MILSAISSQRPVNTERWLLEGLESKVKREEVFAQLIDEYDQRRITAEVG